MVAQPRQPERSRDPRRDQRGPRKPQAARANTSSGPVLMPHNIEAETAILGAILEDASSQSDVLLTLVADTLHLRTGDFYRLAHQTIYAMMLELRASDTRPELVCLTDALEYAGRLDDIGGASYLSPLITTMPSVATAEIVAQWVALVKRDAVARRTITLGERIFQRGCQGGDLSAELATWREQVEALAQDAPVTASAVRFKLWSVLEVLSQPRPDPLIDRVLSLNSTGMLYGPSGVGKSVLVLDMMAHVALGRDWQGHHVAGGHVVYICAEGSAFLPERLQAWMRLNGVEDIPTLHIIQEATQLLDPSTVPALVAAFSQQLDAKPVWVVFDTVSQTSAGADENDPSEMAGYIRAMEQVREQTGAHVLCIHHTGKDESKGFRGASSLKGNIDTVIEIAASSDTSVATMKCSKQRGGWAPFTAWSYRVRKLALDEYADHTGPVIEPAEGRPASAPDDLTESDLMALGALANEPSGMTSGEWERAAALVGVARRTYFRARDRLLANDCVLRQSDAYFCTTTGHRIVSLAHGGSATAPSDPHSEGA